VRSNTLSADYSSFRLVGDAGNLNLPQKLGTFLCCVKCRCFANMQYREKEFAERQNKPTFPCVWS